MTVEKPLKASNPGVSVSGTHTGISVSGTHISQELLQSCSRGVTASASGLTIDSEPLYGCLRRDTLHGHWFHIVIAEDWKEPRYVNQK